MAITELYKALGDESRLRLVNILDKGQFNVQELTAILGVSQSTVSHHLKALSKTGLASTAKEGTWVYYRLNEDQTHAYARDTAKHFVNEVEQADPSLFDTLQSDQRAVASVLNARRDKARDFFETVAKDWKDLREEAQGSESYIGNVRTLVANEETLLELGCGSGVVIDQLLPRQGKTIGVDYSEAMIQEARENLSGDSQNVDLRLGYLEHLPLGDNTVDVALGYMVFHHLAEPQAALQDAARVLRPGGKLVIVDLLEHHNEFMRERFADLWLGFDPKQFSEWSTKAGFCEVKTEVLGTKQDVFLLTAIAQASE